MIRVKISGFIKRNKHKIQDLLTKLIIVAMVVLIATIILSGFKGAEQNEEDASKKYYVPTETVIKGSNVSKEQFATDSNKVDKFLEDCNTDNVEEAYSLLDEECKEELYPTVEDFKKYYYDSVFDKNREYNLQAWISTSNYTVYKIRYTNNMLSTGTYDKEDVYQDYITLNKNTNTISIGNFVYSEECKVETKTKDIEAVVKKKNIYMTYEEYEIQIRNNTSKTILLDTLSGYNSIRLIGNGVPYLADTNKLFLTNLIINPGAVKSIKIRFSKSLNSNNESDRIEFLKAIMDYDSYQQNSENYTNIETIKIKLED